MRVMPTGAPIRVPSCHKIFFFRLQGFFPQNVQPDGLQRRNKVDSWLHVQENLKTSSWNSGMILCTWGSAGQRSPSCRASRIHSHRRHRSCDYSCHHSSWWYRHHSEGTAWCHQLGRDERCSFQQQWFQLFLTVFPTMWKTESLMKHNEILDRKEPGIHHGCHHYTIHKDDGLTKALDYYQWHTCLNLKLPIWDISCSVWHLIALHSNSELPVH